MQAPVVLVNEYDEQIGLADKLIAHQQGLLHRAFSIFILHGHPGQYDILLQQRAAHKYHCGGLWTNACCSHPFEHETIEAAALRRLKEELGFSVPLQKLGVFTYRAQLNNGLIEHEIDHVFIGFCDKNTQAIHVDPTEVMAYQWVKSDELRDKITAAADQFTPWMLEAFSFVEGYLAQ